MKPRKVKEYPAISVNQLAEIIQEQIKKGNGDKKILISGDDEGNSYHGLFYAFIDDAPTIEALSDLFQDEVDINKVVLLG